MHSCTPYLQVAHMYTLATLKMAVICWQPITAQNFSSLQYSQKETPGLNLVFNQFGQILANLHVNRMQLNLQIGYN